MPANSRLDLFNSAFKGLMQFCECVKKLAVVTNHSSNSQQNSSLHNSKRSKNNNDILGNLYVTTFLKQKYPIRNISYSNLEQNQISDCLVQIGRKLSDALVALSNFQ
jgi:hypothetical protein